MPSKALVEKRQQVEAKRTELENLFKSVKTDTGEYDAKKINKTGAEFAEDVKARNTEITALAKEAEQMAETEQIEENLKRRGDGGGGGIPHPEPTDEAGKAKKEKSIGELFVESPAFKNWKTPGTTASLPFEIKTLFQTTAGWAPEITRSPKIVDYAVNRPRMIDVMPMTTTQFAGGKYMEETTYGDAAVEVAEGAVKPEAELALTERTFNLETIAVWIPVTEQQLEDVPRVQAYLENRLRFMLRRRLDRQLVLGSGVSPQIMGVLNKPGIQTQAKGSDPVIDAIRKAATKVLVTGDAEPNAFITHPNDWQDVVLLRTTDGIYIWGNPFTGQGPERIWGLSVVENPRITEGTGVVGDFVNFSEIVTKGGVDVQVGWINDMFTKNQRAIRVEMRAAAVWYRPTAFCSVTGI